MNEKDILERKVLNYIDKNKEATLSEMVDEFDVQYSFLIGVIENLKKRKLLIKID